MISDDCLTSLFNDSPSGPQMFANSSLVPHRSLQENVQSSQPPSSQVGGGNSSAGEGEPRAHPSTVPAPYPASITSPSGFTLGQPPPCNSTTASDGLGWSNPGKDSLLGLCWLAPDLLASDMKLQFIS